MQPPPTQTKQRRITEQRLLPWLSAALLLAHFRDALAWLVRSWQDATYESWGFLALLLLVPLVLRPPARRRAVSSVHLWGVALCLLADLATAPLQLNLLSAVLALLSLHLLAFAHLAFAGRWYAQPQLWLVLLSLPAVYWANVLLGYPVQHAVCRVAAGALGLYGVPVTTEGTLLQLTGGTVLAVDQTCSGLKLLYSGVLLGILLAPSLAGMARKLAFWSVHLGLLFAANVVRVVCLTVAQLYRGEPVGDTVHMAIGLVAFALCCAVSLLFFRTLSPTKTDESRLNTKGCICSTCAEVTP